MDSVAENVTGNKSPLAVIYGDPTEYQFRFLSFAFWYRLPWRNSITLKMESALFSQKPVSIYDPKRSLRSLLCEMLKIIMNTLNCFVGQCTAEGKPCVPWITSTWDIL